MRLTAILEALSAGTRSSVALRYVRNKRLFPGLYVHPTVNHDVKGHFYYGSEVAFAEGCNLIVPDGAILRVGDGCYIGRYVELGPRGEIDIGGHTSIQDRSIIVGDVSVGRYCVLSLNVLMASGTHYFEKWPSVHIRDQDILVANDFALRQKHSRRISVGEDCWFGVNSVVMPGINIGRGCVIGANTVVTRDLGPYSIAVGAPARVIRHRLDFVPPSRIDWRDSEHLPYFYSGFEMAAAERERNKSFQGHVAKNRFALWLAGGTSELRLRAKAIANNHAVLEYGSFREQVVSGWGEYRFQITNSCGPCWFRIEGGPLVVSDAWVQ